MTKLENKLIELGYKALSGYNGEIFFTKFPTKYTNITIATKNGKYLRSYYGPVARMMPKYNSNMQLTIDVLKNDLEELKQYDISDQ